MDESTVVSGPFHSNGSAGVGIIVKRSRAIWTHVGEGYVPVRVIVGDRCSGGYRLDGLRELTALRPA